MMVTAPGALRLGIERPLDGSKNEDSVKSPTRAKNEARQRMETCQSRRDPRVQGGARQENRHSWRDHRHFPRVAEPGKADVTPHSGQARTGVPPFRRAAPPGLLGLGRARLTAKPLIQEVAYEEIAAQNRREA